MISEDERLDAVAATTDGFGPDHLPYGVFSPLGERPRVGVRLGDSRYYTALHAHARDRQYGVVDVGDYLSLVLLNTGHTAPVQGAPRLYRAAGGSSSQVTSTTATTS